MGGDSIKAVQIVSRLFERGVSLDVKENEIKKNAFAVPQDFTTDDWKTENLGRVTGALDREKTGFLLKGAHQAYWTDVAILLNTALALTLKEWSGGSHFVIEQENHGRHLDSVDTSRTIGWFTAMYPVSLALKEERPGDQIKAVKEQLRRVPNHGIGYGIGRYTTPSGEAAASDLTEVRLNYLGQFDQELDNDLFAYSPNPHGSDSHPGNPMTAKLELNAMVLGGVLRLEINYNRKAHRASTIAWLAEALFRNLSGILEHIRHEDSVHVTPSDFATEGLNDEDMMVLFG